MDQGRPHEQVTATVATELRHEQEPIVVLVLVTTAVDVKRMTLWTMHFRLTCRACCHMELRRLVWVVTKTSHTIGQVHWHLLFRQQLLRVGGDINNPGSD